MIIIEITHLSCRGATPVGGLH